jgi:hypothetical protein
MGELSRGFLLEQPSLTIPWGLSKTELTRLLSPYGLRKLSRDHYQLSCTALGGLTIELGFHFELICGSARYTLQIWRKCQVDVEADYYELQRHLESTFGFPTRTEPGSEGYPTHYWNQGDFTVKHWLWEHFDLLDCVGICRNDYGGSMLRRILGALRDACFSPVLWLILLGICLAVALIAVTAHKH